MSVTISRLEIENVKRVKAVALTPSERGLTVIGGNNNQGKTSVLDALAWALGGERYRPSNPQRSDSVLPPSIRLTLSNGLLVERAGKNSSLKVTDPEGRKSGQQLLNEFVEELALNLPKFMGMSSREKADTLLQIIGVGDRLRALERQETELYNRRRAIGQEADRKAKFAQEMPCYPEAPKELVSASDLIRRQQDILARNGENRLKRDALADIHRKKGIAFAELNRMNQEAENLAERIRTQRRICEQLEQDEITAGKTVSELRDESTAELEQDIANVEQINIKVRANLDREKAEEDARRYRQQYAELTTELEKTRQEKYQLLHASKLPLPELSVEDGELTYRGQKWDGMSGSDQLRVSTAIVRALKPDCGFVLLDKLEQMDLDTLRDFGAWLEQEGLQAIATRVSVGAECSIIITDGAVTPTAPEPPAKAWQKGVF